MDNASKEIKEYGMIKTFLPEAGTFAVDQRVLDELNAEEISVGDYVLTGGELPALILTDAIARLQDTKRE